MPLPSKKLAQIRKALLEWYSCYQRDLPWRKTQDPYRILVSEIMLQQTQVARVRQYYERFLERFPTLEELARAPLEEVLKAWEGLGYYARARHLHRAAQIIVRDYNGKIPQEREKLLKLPGIGRYTAGAVLSIAFGKDEPVVDANVRRVLPRLFALRDVHTQTELEELARALLPPGQAGLFNQALMDLGATICLAREPRCLICPLTKLCEARRLGIQNELPKHSKARPKPHYDVAVGIIWRDDKILITKRPNDGLLGGLWEFPGGKRQPNESLEDCVRREILEEVNVQVGELSPFMTVHHSYSHFRVTIHVFQGRYAGGQPRCRGCTAWAWVSLKDLHRYAFPAANKKIIAKLFDALNEAALNFRLRARTTKE